MKKRINKPMRAAGILLVATMLTTCMTAGTFAKYTTTDSATDSARVAKFGVTVAANGTLFGEHHQNVANGNTIVAAHSATTTVDSKGAISSISDVVAPGTKNDSGMGFSVNGTPEVDVRITGQVVAENIFLKTNTYGVMVKKPAGAVTSENFTELDNAENLFYKDGTTYKEATAYVANQTYYLLKNSITLTDDYYPVVYYMDSTNGAKVTYAAANHNHDTLLDVTKQVVSQLTGTDVNNITLPAALNNRITVDITDTGTFAGRIVEANTDLASDGSVNLDGQNIKWEWKFDNVDASTPTPQSLDNADTILGNLMAKTEPDTTFTDYGEVVKLSGSSEYVAPVDGTDYNLDTYFGITLTVTQVD